MHPMKDGGTAGLILAVTTPKGEVLKDHAGGNGGAQVAPAPQGAGY